MKIKGCAIVINEAMRRERIFVLSLSRGETICKTPSVGFVPFLIVQFEEDVKYSRSFSQLDA